MFIPISRMNEVGPIYTGIYSIIMAMPLLTIILILSVI